MIMTRQEVFNTVRDHLLAQGTQSKRAYGAACGAPACAYRGDHGRKCAAGVLVKDEHYEEDMEGLGCAAPLVRDALIDSGVNVVDTEVVCLLQQVHDNVPPGKWPEALTNVALHYGLQP